MCGIVAVPFKSQSTLILSKKFSLYWLEAEWTSREINFFKNLGITVLDLVDTRKEE